MADILFLRNTRHHTRRHLLQLATAFAERNALTMPSCLPRRWNSDPRVALDRCLSKFTCCAH